MASDKIERSTQWQSARKQTSLMLPEGSPPTLPIVSSHSYGNLTQRRFSSQVDHALDETSLDESISSLASIFDDNSKSDGETTYGDCLMQIRSPFASSSNSNMSIDGNPPALPSIAASFDLRDFEPRPIGPEGIRIIVNDAPYRPTSNVLPVVASPSSFVSDEIDTARIDSRSFYSNTESETDFNNGIKNNQNNDIGSLTSHANPSSSRMRWIDYDTANQRRNPTRKWQQQFQDLVTFKARHGHCDVLQEEDDELFDTLGQWAKRQRYHYKLRKLGKKSPMTPTRIQLLDNLGFVWDSHGSLWNTRFAQLQIYHHANGHCNVPRYFPQNQPLSTWVKRQRRQFNKSEISKERMAMLDGLGFSWSARSKPQTKKSQAV